MPGRLAIKNMGLLAEVVRAAPCCGAGWVWAGLTERCPAARPEFLLVLAGVARLNRDWLVHIDDFRLLGTATCRHKGDHAQGQQSFRALRHPLLLYSWKVAPECPIAHTSCEAKAAWVRPCKTVAESESLAHALWCIVAVCDSATSGGQDAAGGNTRYCGFIRKLPICRCHPDK